jgi:error-prone DNA polymerase
MYVELHSRSAFSFLEGASAPEKLVEVCANLGMPAIALLDRDGVYGSPRLHLAAAKAGLKAHIGAEVTCDAFSPQSHRGTESTNKQVSQTSVPLCLGGEYRLPLLVASRTGYQNLCRLITTMKLRTGQKEGARAEGQDFSEHAEGLICLTGGEEGPLAQALAQGGPQAALRSVQRMAEIFGRENVYVELQRHFHRDEEYRNRVAVEIAQTLHLPLLATNGVNYAAPHERELADAFVALRHHRTLATAGRLLARNCERYLKSASDMRALFADHPEAIANTCDLSARLEFTLDDLGYEFPRYPVPEGETMMSFLRERTRDGADRKAGFAWIFPDRLGLGALLPRADHSGARPRVGGEQRGVLFARHYGGGPDCNGPSVRAFSFRRARRMARH